jgi:hypothetical protein
MPSPVVDLLADLDAALGAREIPWFLFGAQAAILYGAARLTADVDITVRLSDGVTPEVLLETLQARRFRARAEDLVIYKLMALRPQDLQDAEGLLVLRGRTMDLTRVRRIVRELAAALDDEERPQALERILQRVGLG